MPRESIAIVKQIFLAVENRDIRAYLINCADDVVIREPSVLPYGGEYRGHDGVVAHAAAWVQAWDRLQPTTVERRLDATCGADGECVVARWTVKGRRNDTRVAFLVRASYRAREGKIIKAEMHYEDPSAVARFLEGKAPSGSRLGAGRDQRSSSAGHEATNQHQIPRVVLDE